MRDTESCVWLGQQINTLLYSAFRIYGRTAPTMLQLVDLIALLAVTGIHHVDPRYSAERTQAGTKSPNC